MNYGGIAFIVGVVLFPFAIPFLRRALVRFALSSFCIVNFGVLGRGLRHLLIESETVATATHERNL